MQREFDMYHDTTQKKIKEKIIRALLCKFLNYHRWSWTLRNNDGTCEPYNGSIPPRAKCKRCDTIIGIDFGTKN